MADAEGMSWGGIAARLLAALLLVYGTWNPMGMSFTHWVILPLFGAEATAATAAAPLKFLLAVILIAGWALYLQATRRSLGWTGALLVMAIFSGLVWLLVSYRVVAVTGPVIAHGVLLGVAILLTIGMCWSHVSRRMTGQIDTDTVE
jgi:hypothetical protein